MCRAYIPSYFFNATSGRCEQFGYGGCDGNENRFQNGSECVDRCSPGGDYVDECLVSGRECVCGWWGVRG